MNRYSKIYFVFAILLLLEIYIFVNLSVIFRYQIDGERINVNNSYTDLQKRSIEFQKIDQLERVYNTYFNINTICTVLTIGGIIVLVIKKK